MRPVAPAARPRLSTSSRTQSRGRDTPLRPARPGGGGHRKHGRRFGNHRSHFVQQNATTRRLGELSPTATMHRCPGNAASSEASAAHECGFPATPCGLLGDTPQPHATPGNGRLDAAKPSSTSFHRPYPCLKVFVAVWGTEGAFHGNLHLTHTPLPGIQRMHFKSVVRTRTPSNWGTSEIPKIANKMHKSPANVCPVRGGVARNHRIGRWPHLLPQELLQAAVLQGEPLDLRLCHGLRRNVADVRTEATGEPQIN